MKKSENQGVQRPKSKAKKAIDSRYASDPENTAVAKSGSGRAPKKSTLSRRVSRSAMSLFLGLLASTGAIAQQGLQLGVQGVPQLSWLMNSDDKDNSDFEYLTTVNGAFGLTTQYGFSDNLGVGLDALYSMQGQRYKLDGTEYYKRIDYVKIPLMLVFSSDLSSSILLLGKIGPQVGLLTDAKLLDNDGKELVGNQTAAYMDYDISGVAMLGVGFRVGGGVLVETSLRYDFGFTDAEDKDYNRNINDPDVAAGDGINDNRATTNNMTAGLNIGIKYLIQ